MEYVKDRKIIEKKIYFFRVKNFIQNFRKNLLLEKQIRATWASKKLIQNLIGNLKIT